MDSWRPVTLDSMSRVTRVAVWTWTIRVASSSTKSPIRTWECQMPDSPTPAVSVTSVRLVPVRGAGWLMGMSKTSPCAIYISAPPARVHAHGRANKAD